MLHDLLEATSRYPAIDNHAHPLLKAVHRDAIPFESLVSEAQGEALKDARHTLACYRATSELAGAYGLDKKLENEPSWESIKLMRSTMDYKELCNILMKPCNIQCLLLDDGLGGVAEFAESLEYHNQFCQSGTRRIVRIEVEAEHLLTQILQEYTFVESELDTGFQKVGSAILTRFISSIQTTLTRYASDDNVVGFKSVICYRTGLAIRPNFSNGVAHDSAENIADLSKIYLELKEKNKIRLEHKSINDLLVCIALEIAAQFDKPVQFHTGLGDNDITLKLSSPAQMQDVIKAYPNTKIVLLHSSYPYTREAGYLTAVYPNVFLDFGEVFPFVSGAGQRSIIRQLLELCPTNKILWSTDGHWFPESFYLGTMQARKAIFVVLEEIVKSGELREAGAVEIVQNALFHNANRVYNLGLEPVLEPVPV